MRNKKSIINLALLLAGIAVASLHIYCKDSCIYLKGSVFGFALDYLGIAYGFLLIVSQLLKKSRIFLLLLSSGIGAELYLFGFQVHHGVYCNYCLAFGGILLTLFMLNFERSKKNVIALSLITGFVMFSIFFEGSVTPSYAESVSVPTFGSGRIKVRIYTDYFCNPCRALEPQLDPLIKSLVKKKTISVMFVDTPIHPPQTILYANYFLYALNHKMDFETAMRARAALFDAAKKPVEKDKLENFLKEKGVRIKPFDTKPVFAVLGDYLKEDDIHKTPTCIIYRDGKKERFEGPAMIKALEALR